MTSEIELNNSKNNNSTENINIVYKAALKLEDFKSEGYSVLRSYKCPLCNGVLDDPVLERCGSEFYCLNCLEIYMKKNGGCPNGNDCLFNNYIKMAFIKKLIEKHEIYCINKNRGCSWEGIVPDLNEHLNVNCDFQPVKCKYEGCILQLNKNNFDLHLIQCEMRHEKCHHCENIIIHKDIHSHIQNCAKLKIPCPQECGEQIERNVLDNHYEKFCQNSKIECMYKFIGCDFLNDRIKMKDHLKNESDKHNLLIFEQIVGIKYKIDNFGSRLTNLENIVDENMKTLQMFINNIINFGIIKKSYENKTSLNNFTESKNSEISTTATPNPINNTTNLIINSETPLKLHESTNKVIEENKSEKNIFSRSATPTKKMFSRKRLRDLENEHLNNNLNHHELNNLINHYIGLEDEITIDTLDKSKGITINVNNAICNNTSSKTEHRFAMTNNVLNNTNAEWTVKIDKLNGKWMGIGVCLKELVVSNKLKFSGNKYSFMHGTFMVSTNGFTWNTFNSEQNNKELTDMPNIQSGDEIRFKFFFEKSELEIIVKDIRIVLTQVSYPRENCLVPCVVFLTPCDEVTFSNIRQIRSD